MCLSPAPRLSRALALQVDRFLRRGGARGHIGGQGIIAISATGGTFLEIERIDHARGDHDRGSKPRGKIFQPRGGGAGKVQSGTSETKN